MPGFEAVNQLRVGVDTPGIVRILPLPAYKLQVSLLIAVDTLGVTAVGEVCRVPDVVFYFDLAHINSGIYSAGGC